LSAFWDILERYRIAEAEKLAMAELQTKLAQAQLENLRLQVQPHFLFNTLNTISTVMYEDVRAADAMITQLSDLLRLTLRASRAQEIPLGEELEIARLYMDLMQKRFESKLRVHYSIDPAVKSSLVPQLILQPLLENSLRHGMPADEAGMDISVTAQRENGSARFAGAAEVVSTDVEDAALTVAKTQMGATRTVNVASDARGLAEFEVDGGYFDVALEVSGAAVALASLFKVIRRGGRIVQVGMLPPGTAPVPVNVLQTREIEFVGAFRANDEFRRAVEMIVSDAIDVAPILSGTYPLADVVAALERAGDRSKVVKLHLAINEGYR
jgi:hypothetical protein